MSQLESVMRFGFRRNEGKAYLAILALGEATAASTARHSGIARQEAYRVVSSLEELGVVERVVSDPTRFRAVSPRTALARLIEHEKERFQEKLTELHEVVDYLGKGFDCQKCESRDAGSFTFVMHTRRILDREIESIGSAREEILFVGSADEISHLHDHLKKVLTQTLKKSEHVKVICTNCPTTLNGKRPCEILLVACLPGFPGHVLLIDRKRTIVKIDQDTALETDKPMFVMSMNYLSKVLLQTASSIANTSRIEYRPNDETPARITPGVPTTSS